MKPAEFEEFKETFGEEFASDGNERLPIINEWRPWPWGRQYNFWATDADKCPRRMFFLMWAIPESNPDLSDETINIFAIGNKVEEHVVSKYRQLRGTMWEQGHFGHNLLDDPAFRKDLESLNSGDNAYGVNILDMFMPRITGKMDIVFDDLSKVFDKKVRRYIVEVKSIKDWPFASHKRKGEDEPYFIGLDMVTPEGYYLQECQYLYFNQVERGMIHFVNKNTGAERIWNVELDAATNAVENIVLPRFKKWYIAYLKKELPAPPYEVKLSKDKSRILKTGSDWHCQYCSYSSLCWGLDGFTIPEEDDNFGNQKVTSHDKQKPEKKTRKRRKARRQRKA